MTIFTRGCHWYSIFWTWKHQPLSSAEGQSGSLGFWTLCCQWSTRPQVSYHWHWFSSWRARWVIVECRLGWSWPHAVIGCRICHKQENVMFNMMFWTIHCVASHIPYMTVLCLEDHVLTSAEVMQTKNFVELHPIRTLDLPRFAAFNSIVIKLNHLLHCLNWYWLVLWDASPNIEVSPISNFNC
jgi:hypothetical protein